MSSYVTLKPQTCNPTCSAVSGKPRQTGQQEPFKKLRVCSSFSILALGALQEIISEAGISYCFVHPREALLLYLLVPFAVSHLELPGAAGAHCDIVPCHFHSAPWVPVGAQAALPAVASSVLKCCPYRFPRCLRKYVVTQNKEPTEKCVN